MLTSHGENSKVFTICVEISGSPSSFLLLVVMASNLRAMASKLVAMASNLRAMASNLRAHVTMRHFQCRYTIYIYIHIYFFLEVEPRTNYANKKTSACFMIGATTKQQDHKFLKQPHSNVSQKDNSGGL